MLRFHRIEIRNFICFDDVIIKPSTDSDKPLTVIKGESGSGKTTLLQAVRWGMYGEEGLFGNYPERFSLHPVDWVPNSDGIETKVAIEFETDGSAISDSSTPSSPLKTFRLERSVTTVKISREKGSDKSDFGRKGEQISVKQKEPDGQWRPRDVAVNTIMDQLLPRDLSDFFVMNADQATDYVGGHEVKEISRKEVIQKTTGAINNLLGINVFKGARDRVSNIAQSFGRQATAVVGSGNLVELQTKLDKLRKERVDLEEEIEESAAKKSDYEEKRDRLQSDLMQEVRDNVSHKNLATQKEDNHQLLESERKKSKSCLGALADKLKSPDLLAALARSQITNAYELLKPLYEKGLIPQKHIYFVRGLLMRNRCVCGRDLSKDDAARGHVRALIEKSEKDEQHANHLGRLYESTSDMRDRIGRADDWREQYRNESEQFSIIENNISDLENESKEINRKMTAIDESRIRVLMEEDKAIEQQREDILRHLTIKQSRLDLVKSEIKKLEQDIGEQQRKDQNAKALTTASSIASAIEDIILHACSAIQKEQIESLSEQMNKLFSQMTSGVSISEDEKQDLKVPLRMITRVGLRSTESDSEKFEIYALNVRGRPMLPTEINGASRRIIALSFVLALCEESKTKAPLVADSLLNFTSGPVRENVLLIAAKKSFQPILLLTESDLESSTEVNAVNRYAGATYTLTVDREDIVNFASDRPISLVCECGPRQYCSICEKQGRREKPGWSNRE